jgi:hypothetical protein
MEKIRVQLITPEDTYPVRSAELRQGLPIESCHFDGDHDNETIHIGCFVDDTLATVVSFCQNSHEKFNSFFKPQQYQLRGMATLEAFRGKGLGLGTKAIEKAKEILSGHSGKTHLV